MASQEEGKKPNKNFLRFVLSLVVYAVGAILLMGGLLVLIWLGRPYFALYLSPQKKVLEEKVRLDKVKGDRLIIPSILVDAEIVEGATKVNLRRGVAHVSGSTYPGAKGNAIVEGHNYVQFGGDQAFFSLLHKIKEGAPIHVYFEGKKYHYRVARKKILKVSNPNLYQTTTSERLTLITCASDFSSLSMISPTERIVVTAKPSL